MAQCPNCGKKGFLLQLTKNGVCPDCKTVITNEISIKFEVIVDIIAEMKQSKDLKKILSGTDTVLTLTSYLSSYDKYNFVETKFSELESTMKTEKENFIMDYFKFHLQLARGKVEVVQNVEEGKKHFRNFLESAIDSLVHLGKRRKELEELIDATKKEQKNFEYD